MKRLLSVLMALLMLFLCLPTSMAEDVPTLTLWVPDNPNVSDWHDNEQTKHIEEVLGIHLEFVKMPNDSKEYQSKIDLAMFGGGEDLPDIIITNFSLSLVQLQLYTEAGFVVDITDYVKESTPQLDANLADLNANPLSKEE